MAHVFVYGTFLRGGANHALLLGLGARFVRAALTEDRRTLVDLGPYPALLPRSDRDATRVHGELYELPDTALAELDAFEGTPDLYTRETIALEGGAIAFTYVFARRLPGRARILADGRYEGAGAHLADGARPAQVEDELDN
jgi:gamma-glutamylaminecyclotransferase